MPGGLVWASRQIRGYQEYWTSVAKCEPGARALALDGRRRVRGERPARQTPKASATSEVSGARGIHLAEVGLALCAEAEATACDPHGRPASSYLFELEY